MTDTAKPPMVVWLTGNMLPCEATSKRFSIWAETGPYVHLDQFLAEVEKRANRNPKTRSWDMSLGEAKADATQELAKEIKERK